MRGFRPRRRTAPTGPRVRLTYQPGDDRGDEREIPFVIGVMGDFAGQGERPAPFARREFLKVSAASLDRAIARIAPALTLAAPNTLVPDGPEIHCRLTFRGLADFGPHAVAAQVSETARLAAARQALAEMVHRLSPVAHDGRNHDTTGSGRVEDLLSALDRKLGETEPDDTAGREGLIREVTGQAARFPAPARGWFIDLMQARIADLDHSLSVQVSAILHHPDFQRLEAAWRGLAWLTGQVPTGQQIHIRLLDVGRDELEEDLNEGDLRRSRLYQLLYTEEYGQFGGDPFGVMVLDMAFTRARPDLDLLEKIATIAGAAHLPVLAGADAALLGLRDLTELGGDVEDVGAQFDMPGAEGWQRLRTLADARHIGLALPRVRGRVPHPLTGPHPRSFRFTEDLGRDRHRRTLWMSAAWPLAERIAHAFDRHGWCVAITGLTADAGVVSDLAVDPRWIGESWSETQFPVEVALTEIQESDLVAAGLIPLVQCQHRDRLAFFRVPSIQKPADKGSSRDRLSARLSAQLPYLFAACRVAHYLKVIMRERLGGGHSRIEIETALNRWLANYIAYQDDAAFEVRAARPLRDGGVTVDDVPNDAGLFTARVDLQPHFQIEEVDFSLRLTTELPIAATAET